MNVPFLLVGLFVVLGVVIALAVAVTLRKSRRRRASFERCMAELGFEPHLRAGRLGRFHWVGARNGRRTVVGYLQGAGYSESAVLTSGIELALLLDDADVPPGFEAYRPNKGSRLALVLQASWPEYEGPIARLVLSIDSDTHAIAEALDGLGR